jgi:hypothetical protein
LEIGNFDLYKNGVKTIDFEWRQDIAVNQELDACDKMGIWYQSTVLDIRIHRGDDCRKVTQAKIGYRYYSDTGNKKDENQLNYNGWSSIYDEWISVTSPRIALLHTKVKSYETLSNDVKKEEDLDIIEDSYDA